MSSRVRPPVQSFLLFVLLCVACGVAWVHRGDLDLGGEDEVEAADSDEIRQAVEGRFSDEEAWIDLQTVSWRPQEGRYRVDLQVRSGFAAQARVLCERVATYIHQRTESTATVIAYDSGGREVARYVL